MSNVLNHRDLVAASTVARVENAINELGFVRNETARQLRVGASGFVGVVVPDSTRPSFAEMVRGVEEAAVAAGLLTVVVNSEPRSENETRAFERLAAQRIRGVLVATAEVDERRFGVLDEGRVPYAVLDHRVAGGRWCAVAVDEAMGGRIAAEHLLSSGHRQLAFVGGGLGDVRLASRYEGVMAAVSASGDQTIGVTRIDGASLSVSGGRFAAQRLAALAPTARPTAAICGNDLVGIGLAQEAHRLGSRIPEDLAIVASDDSVLALSGIVPITSLRQPWRRMGRVGLQLLLEERGDPHHVHRTMLLEPELVVRESSELHR